MKYYLGIDAGGTKTVGAIADEERELARAQTGTIKLMRTDSAHALSNLQSLLDQLATSRGIGLHDIAGICVGAAGFAVPTVTNWIRQSLETLTGCVPELCGDEEIALDAAFHGSPGVLVVAGTGSNIVGRNSKGETAHAGGWGPALADEGSGHWIGHEGLRSAFRALNAGKSTLLFDAIFNYWKLNDIEELVEYANRFPAPDFSRLTPLVVGCAEKGDVFALEVLHQGGEDLAHLASQVMRRLSNDGAPEKWRVAFTGSVLQRIALVREAMIAALHRDHAGIEVLPEAVDPVAGALWRMRKSAMKSAGEAAKL
jgi:glucosamine kinase